MNIKEILNEIKELENYCSPNKATKTTFNKTKEFFGEMPEDLQEFYKLYDGGLFFGQDFANITLNDCYSFQEMNSDEYKEMYYIPNNVVVFADTGYGDFVGYNKDTKQIIQINPENEEDEWITYNSFTEYLEEFVADSKKLIEEEVLESLR